MSLSVVTSSSSGCPRCGIIQKSNTLSCCARGGAWFKQCGDVGDAQLHHTWSEGIQACKGFVKSIPKALPQHVVLHRMSAIVHLVGTAQARNATAKNTNRSRLHSVPNDSTTNCAGIPKVAVRMAAVLILLSL